jgi:hypothetical protein
MTAVSNKIEGCDPVVAAHHCLPVDDTGLRAQVGHCLKSPRCSSAIQCEAVISRQTFSPRARNCHAGESAPEISSFRERSPKPSGNFHVTFPGARGRGCCASRATRRFVYYGIDAHPRIRAGVRRGCAVGATGRMTWAEVGFGTGARLSMVNPRISIGFRLAGIPMVS